MNRELNESRTQYSEGRQVPIGEILRTLCQKIGLTDVGEELQIWQIKLVFFVCYQQYHSSSNCETKAWRCIQDVNDYFAGEPLPRYVVCGFEQEVVPLPADHLRPVLDLLAQEAEGCDTYDATKLRDYFTVGGFWKAMRISPNT